MHPNRLLALTALVGMVLSSLPLVSAWGTEVERSVADVLRQAAHAGLRIIYSDALVRPEMRVIDEPASLGRVDALREILRPHTLALVEVAPGVFAVTRAGSPAGAEHVRPDDSPFAELEEVRIVSSRYTVRAAATPPYSALAFDIERQPALFEDATRSLRRFPGTAGSPLTARLFVRGGVADENLLLLDGVPLDDPFHLPGLPADVSFIDPAVLDRVELYSGVQPVEYDERMSAVVNMRTRRPAEYPGGRISLGFANASMLLAAPISSGSGDWLVFARRSLLDQAARIVNPDFGRPALADAFGRFQYRLRDDALLTLGMLVADDSLALTSDANTELLTSESDRKYLWAALEKRWDDLTSRTLLTHSTGSMERNGSVLDTGYGFGNVHDVRRMSSTLLRQDWTLPLEPEGALRWGAAIKRDSGALAYERHAVFPDELATLFSQPRSSTLTSRTNTTVREHAAYFGATRSLGTRWMLEGGAHWSLAEYAPGRDESGIDPRLTVLYRFSPDTRARLSWGRMRQRWRATELPLEVGAVKFGTSATSTMLVAGLEHDFRSRFFVRVEAFDKYARNPRPRRENLLDALVLLPELHADAIVVAPARVRVTGIDVYATAELSDRSHAWLSYSWSNAREFIDGTAIARSWDQRHALGLGIAFDYRGWQFSAATTLRSHWPVTPVIATEFAPGLEIGSRNAERDRLFGTLDLKAARHVELSRGELSIVFEIMNATNTLNVCCSELHYETGADGLTASTEPKHWPQIVPLVSVAWEF